MTRRAGLAVGCAVLGAISYLACFPEYSFVPAMDGGAEAGMDAGREGAPGDGGCRVYADSAVPPGMVRMTPCGAFNVVGTSETLTRGFDIDEREVSVGRFNAWLRAGTPLPCTNCTLDPGGSFAETMKWTQDLLNGIRGTTPKYPDAGFPDAGGNCEGPNPYPGGNTFLIGKPDLPMTCVNWYEAVAFCASEGKRLPTEAEWRYVATDRGRTTDFPFFLPASPTVSCSDCTCNADDAGCGFPYPKTDGSISAGGVHDLSGSVYEWIWDLKATLPSGPLVDYVGAASTQRLRLGGAYIDDPTQTDGRLHANIRVMDDAFDAYQAFIDAGFRCVKTIR